MKRKFIILSTVITMVLTTACGNSGNSKTTTASDNTTNLSDKEENSFNLIEYLADINANTELGEKIVIDAEDNTNEKKELYNRIAIPLAENWTYTGSDLKVDKYCYNNQTDTASYVNFGYNCNYVCTGSTCTEAEFTERLKQNLDFRIGGPNMPTRISEVQIGQYKGYEYYEESPSDKRTNVTIYHMWIDGYHVEFFIGAYNAVDPDIYEEAYNSAMQSIASIEILQ